MRVRGVDGTAGALRAVAELAGAGDGTLVVANADILTQREALAGLLADPRVADRRCSPRPSGASTATSAFRTRTRRGRVVSAGTPYHYVHGPNGTFLGVLKIAPARPRRAGRGGRAARRARRRRRCRDGLAGGARRTRRAAGSSRCTGARCARSIDPEQAEEQPRTRLLERGRRGATSCAPRTSSSRPDEAASSSAGVRRRRERRPLAAALRARALRRPGRRQRTCAGCSGRARCTATTSRARPSGSAELRRGQGAARLRRQGERRLLHDVLRLARTRSTSRAGRRAAAGRPNGVTTLSVCIGVRWPRRRSPPASAGAWSPARSCSSSRSRSTASTASSPATRARSPSSAPGWTRSSTAPRSTLVFAGLAIGAARTGDDVWLLAGAALALQVLRHCDRLLLSARPAPGDGARAPAAARAGQRLAARRARAGRARARAARSRRGARRAPAEPRAAQAAAARRLARARPLARGVRWVKKIVALPDRRALRRDLAHRRAVRRARDVHRAARLGRRSPRRYTIAGRVLRSLGAPRRARRRRARAPPGTLDAYRDDGPLALALGAALAPRALPGRPRSSLAALALVLAVADRRRRRRVVVARRRRAGRLARAARPARRAGRPLRDRLRWAVPPPLRVDRVRAASLWLAALAGPSRSPPRSRCCARSRSATTTSSTACASAASTPPRWLNRVGRRLGRAAARRASCSRPPRPCRRASTPRRRARGRVRRPRRRTAGRVRAHAAAATAYEDEEEDAE